MAICLYKYKEIRDMIKAGRIITRFPGMYTGRQQSSLLQRGIAIELNGIVPEAT